ncbi:PAAR domain-containing protein [Pseudomonas faucium]|uniref:PAAR domain-containing protein n=1 Tax=Pseudomonas faucium TaxID=2740518 RepID=UPI0039C05262
MSLALSVLSAARLYRPTLSIPELPEMLQAFVLLGDRTTHDGSVISASSTTIVNGKPVALVGDKVNCPIPGHGTNPIVEGSEHWSENGVALVVDSCRSECGCRVIASTCECGVG